MCGSQVLACTVKLPNGGCKNEWGIRGPSRSSHASSEWSMCPAGHRPADMAAERLAAPVFVKQMAVLPHPTRVLWRRLGCHDSQMKSPQLDREATVHIITKSSKTSLQLKPNRSLSSTGYSKSSGAGGIMVLLLLLLLPAM